MPEIVDIGEDMEEENKVCEKAVDEYKSTVVSHDPHDPMPAELSWVEPHKEPYVTSISTERAAELTRGSTVSAFEIAESSTSDECTMGGENSKQTNNLIIENVQKALVAHKESKKMILIPGD